MMKKRFFSMSIVLLSMLTLSEVEASKLDQAKSSSKSFVIKGGKVDNSGVGGFYPWEDKKSIKGLKFHAKEDFILKSVKLYNEKGHAGERVISLLDKKKRVIAKKKVFIKDGESRVVLNFKVPKGRAYRLLVDSYKGLYRNTDAKGFPYKIGKLAKIVNFHKGSNNYYFFYDWELIPVTARVTDKVKVNKPVKVKKQEPVQKISTRSANHKEYIPTEDLSKTDVYGNGKVITVSNADELEYAVANLSSQSTIILKDGLYRDIHVAFPKGVHHITIKGEHKNGAKILPLGSNDRSAFIFYNDESERNVNHHINFVDFDVIGSTDDNKQFLKNPASHRYGPSFIYMKNINFKNQWMGIFSSLHAHDWTVDSCSFENSQMSHAWYMMGWHMAVINSVFKNGSHDDLVIRGYYPSGELYDYYDDGDSDCRVNVFVENRTNRRGFLAKDDWTHLIRHNQFLSWDMKNPQRSEYNTHLGIAYGIYGGDGGCNAERVYLPPQNIEISDNLFDNRQEAQNAYIDAIMIDARAGINNKSLSSINGIVLKNNIFYPQKRQEKFISHDDDRLDINSIESIGNKIEYRGN